MCELSAVGMRSKSYHPQALVRMSKETDVSIVRGTGFYWESFLSEGVRRMGVREMVDLMEGEIAGEGGEGGEGRCGVVYIGCTWPLKDSEKRALEAAVLTQRETGCSE